MPEQLHWSYPVAVADLPADGIEVELAPDAEIRAALARHVGVLAVPELVARFKITPDGRGGAEVEGNLAATVRQTCVVTLEPFDNRIAEPIAVSYSPTAAVSSVARSVEMRELDQPDPLIGGVFDLAALAAEFLALAIDPYPRKPGAVFEPPAEGGREGESAFAALAKLKRPPGGQA